MTQVLQFKYLMKVDGGLNSNKFYKMAENADGTFTSTYGREGATKPAIETYPMSKWDIKLKEKLSSRKGYTDQTENRAEIVEAVSKKSSTGAVIISHDKYVSEFISTLQAYAKQQTAATYKVEAKGVTQKQIDNAQKHIDNLSYSFKNHFKAGWNINMFNTELTKLYMVIPRKMKSVIDHLINDQTTQKEIETLIETEQSNIDSLAGQVLTQTAEDNDDATDTKLVQHTLLDSMGLEMKKVSDKYILDDVKKRAEQHGKRVLNVFEVINKSTQKSFDNQLAKSSNKKCELLWHGSRNANWIYIIQQGLRIRPSGAVHTGSMFGDGIYFASEADKSMGYTDNGRWVNGNARASVYMALYNVHLGKQYEIESSDSSLSSSKLERLGKYDSTWGKKGRSLIRHEYITYKSEQSTIKYIVEFSA